MESLSYLALIWVGVLIAVFLADKSRLTPVLYYLAIGALFVTLGLLPEEPTEFLRSFAELGIIFIMFAIGFEEQADDFLASAKRSWGIAFFGALAPFLAAYGVTWYYWHDFAISLMSGLTMTATAVSLTMVVLRSEGLGQSDAATRIMTSAVLDDIASLTLLALMIPIASGGDLPSALEVILILAKIVAFFAVVSILGVWVFPHHETSAPKFLLTQWMNLRSLLRFQSGRYATLVLMLLALVIGLLSHAFGFHPAVGAYMAGLILREEYFNYADRSDSENFQEVKHLIDNVAFVWIGPVFFVLLGTHLVFDWELFVSLIPQTLALTLSVLVAQVASASIAARYTSGMDRAGSILVGLGMLGRAELAFVVMDIAYVQHQILTKEVFYTLMFTAFWLNLLVPISIRFWKPYYQAELETIKHL